MIEHLEDNPYGRSQLGIVTAVQWLAGQPAGVNIFSGFVAVKLLTMNLNLGWVRWTNPLVGQTMTYGVMACPAIDDTVYVDFDPRGFAYVSGKLTFPQGMKPNGNLDDHGVLNRSPYPTEASDFRLQLKEGEVLVRGSQTQSTHFRADGSIVIKTKDTLDDSSTLFIQIDANNNVTMTGVDTASVTANEIDLVSGSVNLGNGSIKSPLLRASDVSSITGFVMGTPGTTPLPVTLLPGSSSATTQSS